MPKSILNTIFPTTTWEGFVLKGCVYHLGTIPKGGYQIGVTRTPHETIAYFEGVDCDRIEVADASYPEALKRLRRLMPQSPPWVKEDQEGGDMQLNLLEVTT